jgi:hypothetical protein
MVSAPDIGTVFTADGSGITSLPENVTQQPPSPDAWKHMIGKDGNPIGFGHIATVFYKEDKFSELMSGRISGVYKASITTDGSTDNRIYLIVDVPTQSGNIQRMLILAGSENGSMPDINYIYSVDKMPSLGGASADHPVEIDYWGEYVHVDHAKLRNYGQAYKFFSESSEKLVGQPITFDLLWEGIVNGDGNIVPNSRFTLQLVEAIDAGGSGDGGQPVTSIGVEYYAPIFGLSSDLVISIP